jgi:hypothetical protein
MDSQHDCRPPPAVAIEPSLRSQSPENGNIFKKLPETFGDLAAITTK